MHDVWEVDVSQIGATSFHVQPLRGIVTVENWAINPHHRRGLSNLGTQLWRVFTGTYIRREFPKSERALRKAIAECESFCEHEMADERRLAAIAAKVASR